MGEWRTSVALKKHGIGNNLLILVAVHTTSMGDSLVKRSVRNFCKRDFPLCVRHRWEGRLASGSTLFDEPCSDPADPPAPPTRLFHIKLPGASRAYRNFCSLIRLIEATNLALRNASIFNFIIRIISKMARV